MPSDPVVALEVGTSKVVALVGETREDGRLTVIGMGEHASKGVRKGEIVDVENAAACVRSALHAAEENGQVMIRRVHVALSGGHIQSDINRGSCRVMGAGGEITRADIDQVMDLARAMNMPPEREVLHSIGRQFCIDDDHFVMNPEGLEGAKLSLDMIVIHGIRNRLRNTVKVVQNLPMDVQDVAFSGLCSSMAVLSPEQKEIGAIVIDLGGGTTGYVAYSGKVMAAIGSLGVGGDHITNDISLAFGISARQAEMLKREHGAAEVDIASRGRRVTLPPEVGFPGRSINLASLQTVVNARIHEIFRMIKVKLDPLGLNGIIGSGVILTGGGSRLHGVCGLAERVFNLPCRAGAPWDVDGLASAVENPEYTTAVGMLRYGFANARAKPPFSWREFLKRLFGSGS